jgi:hypothetical protein
LTRIVFMVWVRFAGVVVRERALDFALWLTRRVDHPRRRRVEILGRRVFFAHFRLTSPEEVDESLAALLRESYGIGHRAHLRS